MRCAGEVCRGTEHVQSVSEARQSEHTRVADFLDWNWLKNF